jgi:glyoxylate reductase
MPQKQEVCEVYHRVLTFPGISVSNTPGAVDEATATTAVYLLLATMRNFSYCEAHLRSGHFAPPKRVEAESHDLSGKVIGILGMGGIGRRFVDYIRPFGMVMLYHNRRVSPFAPPDVEYKADLYDMLASVDVLVVSIPLSDATRGFVGEKEIRTLKKGSIIINTARGPIIDEEAMIKALEDGHVSVV